MQKFTVSELVQRHRLSLAQIDRLKWGEVDRKDLLEEKLESLSKANQIQIVLDQLAETGIFFICLKGFVLSNRLYNDPTFRFSHDLDILVPDRDGVIRLRKKLIEKGWIPVGEDWVEDRARRDWVMDITMDFGLIEPKTGILVEIHWELDKQILNFFNDDLKKFLPHHLEKMTVLNRQVNVLSPELELTYLLVHGAKHAWFRLKWLVDIHHYPFHQIDQNKFQILVNKFNLNGILAQTNELLITYFGKGFPFQNNRKANAYLVQYAYQQNKADVMDISPTALQFFKYLIYNWFLTPNRITAFKMLFGAIGIRPQDISQVKLDSYWKYFFYRYYSLINRKIFKRKLE